MCPPGYHHNDIIMAARKLGHTMYMCVKNSDYPPGPNAKTCFAL